MRVDEEQVVLLVDDFRPGAYATLLRLAQHLDHLGAVAAQLAGIAADPHDVRREGLAEGVQVASLDRVAHAHHRRSSL